MNRSAYFHLGSVRIAIVVYLAYCIAAAFVPLLSSFGFEFALFYAAIVSIFASVVTADSLCARFVEKDRIQRARAITDVGLSEIFVGAVIRQAAIFVLPAVIFSLVSLVRCSTCNWRLGLAWFFLLPVVSAVCAVAWGVLVASFITSRRLAKAIAVAGVVGTIFYSLYSMAVGPHCFAFNPFFGYFPGPIYDRVVSIGQGFLVYRTANLVGAALMVLVPSILLKYAVTRKERSSFSWFKAQSFWAAVCLVSIILFWAYKADLGLTSSEKIIKKELSFAAQTEHFTIHYQPDSQTAEWIDWIAIEHEFRFSQIENLLKIDFPRKIYSYIYVNEFQKKRLQGAGPTMYADVSNDSIHMNEKTFPHPVLKHELTHVISSEWGIPYFGWSSRIGLTEGVAVAAEGFRGDGDIHQWAAAMLQLEKLPRIEKILDPLGFWTQLGSRAYLAAGSFSLWLIQTKGADAYRAAYTWGDFKKAYGKDVSHLGSQWTEFLSTIEVPQSVMAEARHKFFRKSLFDRRCAREVERLLFKAKIALRKNRYHDALKVLEQVRRDSPDNPKASVMRIDALIGAKNYRQAYREAIDLLQAQGSAEIIDPKYSGNRSARYAIEAISAMARIDWMLGNKEKAREHFQLLEKQTYRQSVTRFALCALHALENHDVEPFLKHYLASETPRNARTYFLARAQSADPKDPIVNYLLGRLLFADRQYFAATSCLLRAMSASETPKALRVESYKLLGQALFFQKRFDEALIVFDSFALKAEKTSQDLETAEWIERVIFFREWFGKNNLSK